MRIAIGLPRSENTYKIDYDPEEHSLESLEGFDFTGLFVSVGDFPDWKMVPLYEALLHKANEVYHEING